MTAALTHPVTGVNAKPLIMSIPTVTSILAMSPSQQQAAANNQAAQAAALQQQQADAQAALATAQAADMALNPPVVDGGIIATMGPWLWVGGAAVAVVMIIAGIVLTHPKKPPLSGHRRRRRSRR